MRETRERRGDDDPDLRGPVLDRLQRSKALGFELEEDVALNADPPVGLEPALGLWLVGPARDEGKLERFAVPPDFKRDR